MATAVGAAELILDKVLTKLSDERVALYVASPELGLDSEQISRDLKSAHQLLRQAHGRDIGHIPAVNGLLVKLNEKAGEAEDALNELQYFIIQDQLDGTQLVKPDLGSGLKVNKGNWLPCFSRPCTSSSQHGSKSDSGDHVEKLAFDSVSMSVRIKSVVERIHYLCQVFSDLLRIPNNSSSTTTATPVITKRPFVGSAAQDRLYGREAIFEQTIGVITSCSETLSVLPVVGLGGIGKTTFVQHLYNDARIEKHFVVRIWVHVGDKIDMPKVTQQILEFIPASDEGSSSAENEITNLVQLQISIARRLESERFLLVLDDVCPRGSDEDWNTLLAPFTEGEAKGNVVLVTTRYQVIAPMMKILDPIELPCLDSGDFFAFFEECIFGDLIKPGNYENELIDIARAIAEKLCGVPLAGKSVGRMLRQDLSLQHWMRILEGGVLDAFQPHPNLRELRITNYGGAGGPSWFCVDSLLKKLEALHLEGVSLDTLPPFGQLPHLTRLSLKRVSGVHQLGIQDMASLESLMICRCGSFFSLCSMEEAGGGTPFPASLKKLGISSESGIESMSLLSNLTSLTHLTLQDCVKLTVDGFNPLITVNLKVLVVYNCRWDRSCPESIAAGLLSEVASSRVMPAGSFQLEQLKVDSISTVLVAPICNLVASTLHTLIFCHDQRAKSFTEEQEKALLLLTSLRHLSFDGCGALQSLPRGLHRLSSLQDLDVLWCPEIRSIPKEGFPVSLRNLRVRPCSADVKEQIEKIRRTNPDLFVMYE